MKEVCKELPGSLVRRARCQYTQLAGSIAGIEGIVTSIEPSTMEHLEVPEQTQGLLSL